MDYKNLESSKFYSYKFKNFSTMIILPVFLLVVFILIGSIFAVREKTIKLVGIIEPTSSLNIKNTVNYHEGQCLNIGSNVILTSGKKKKLNQKSEVHLAQNKVILFPNLDNQKNLEIVSYAPNDEVSYLKRNQKIKFQIRNRYGENIIINGKIESVAIYPKEVNDKEAYLVVSSISPSKSEKAYLRYGMQSQVSVIVNRQTYFNFLKEKIFDEK
ncbi:ABC transporter permease [Lactobacillus sp. LL6]|uniref:ABC transporter permease n=1 Tax=Lactobacillus sp. LL6 TaxID=2596827 RepID=UPI001185431B|nr:ABC transporter permease [Lactobacillus sp. LL6]TSO25770.1 ABC transporter permease [Lactobacillus sp. LL6]